MITLPPNEAERMDALHRYAILDTPPEPAFDRIAMLAARLLRVPFALVTLVDEHRLWFKACHGLGVNEAGRDLGFCAHTILQNDIFLIPDTHADPFYVTNPLVVGAPFIRFYAGAPLISSDGYALGSLCVLDTQPRTLLADEQATLRDLAAVVVDELELRMYMRATEAEMAERAYVEAEQEATLQALAESEAQLRAVVEQTSVIVYIKDRDGRYLLINQAGADLLGRPIHMIMGQHGKDVLSPEHYAQSRAIDAQVLATHQSYSYEHEVNPHDGRTLLTTKSPYIGPNGDVLGVVGIGRDITERKRAEAEREAMLRALGQSEARFRAAFDASPLGMAVVSPHGRWLQVNPALCEIVGYTEEELLSAKMQALVHPQHVAEYRASLKRLLRGHDDMCEFGTRYIHKKGHTVWVAVAVSLVRDAAGLPCYGILQVQNITKRKEAQDALRHSEARKTAMLETALDGIITFDNRGRITEFNAAAEDMFGYHRCDMLGQQVIDLVVLPPTLTLDAVERRMLAADQRVVNRRHELQAKRADGSVFPAELSVTRSVVDDLPFFTAYVRDITERKEAEAVLRQAKEEAEHANRAKSDFLGRMSHELRTPLNAILGFAQVLGLDPLDGDQRDSVAQILKAGNHLLQLINEVLDIARIEAGRMALSPEPVLVSELVAETLDMVYPLAAQRHISVHTPALADDAARYVLADRQRLKQVLLNLLSNAIKYNKAGGSVTISSMLGEHDRLRIAIRDTGPGIAPTHLHKVWDPFDRLGAEHSGVEGTGLGLALSKRLVEAMNGTITVESTPGEGSTFVVELQLAEGPLDRLERLGDLPASPAVFDDSAYTVVYVEDNLSNLTLIERILQHRPGIKLLPAMQGRTGLDLVRDHQPDLVLLDLHLPDMNGHEVLRALQADDRTAHVPVVVLSADATDGQIQRLMAAGAAAYITKPLNIHEFLHTLDRALEQKV